MGDSPRAKLIVSSINRNVNLVLELNNIEMCSTEAFETSMQYGMNAFYQSNADPLHSFKLHIIIMAMKGETNTATVQAIQTKGNESNLVDCFQVAQFDIEKSIRDKLSITLTYLGIPSFPQIFQILIIREQLLKYIKPKEFLQVESTCKLMKDICSNQDVDLSFWRTNLKKKFNKEKADCYRTHREAYKQLTIERNKDQIRPRVSEHSVLDPAHSFLENPSRRRPYPSPGILPNPFVDPFGPLGPGPLAPGYQQPFGGRDPFDGQPPGLGSEFLPSRAPHNYGPRGPPSMGPGGWPQFDRNDII